MEEAKHRKPPYQPDLTDRAFRISLALKALNAAFEILSGLALLLVRPNQIDRLAHSLSDGRLRANPNDFIGTHIHNWAGNITKGSLIFGSIYLLSHGVVKLFVVVNVWRNRSWAYPLLLVVIGLFVVYQLYHMIFVRYSHGMLALTIFDLIIIWLTAIEYKRHKARRDFAED